MIKSPIRPVIVLAASALLFGCATSSELDEVRSLAQQASSDAAAAKQAAATAERAAAAAQARADAAMDAAASAKAQSEQTESKIDRMFKKAMYK